MCQEACSEPCQTSMIECFAKIVNGSYLLTIFTKRFILNVFQGSEHVFICSWGKTRNMSVRFPLFEP